MMDSFREQIIKGLKYASEITGKDYRPEDTQENLALFRDHDWLSNPEKYVKFIGAVADFLKTSQTYKFVPLSRCVPGVTNVDLLFMIGIFVYNRDLTSPDSMNVDIPYSIESDIKDAISLIYSGYALDDLSGLILSLDTYGVNYSFDRIVYFIYNIQQWACRRKQRNKPLEYQDLGCYNVISKAIPNIEQLALTGIAIDPNSDLVKDILDRFGEYRAVDAIRYLKNNRVEIFCKETGFRKRTVMQLLDAYIPFIFPYSTRRKEIENLKSIATPDVSCFEELFELAFEGTPDILRELSELHKDAFDALVTLLLTHEILDHIRCMMLNGMWSDISMVVSGVLLSELEDLSSIIVENLSNPEQLYNRVLTKLSAIQTFSEGMLELINDPIKKPRLERLLEKDYPDITGPLVVTWIDAAEDYIKQRDILTRFPSSLAVAVLKEMPLDEVMAEIMTREGVSL